MLEDTKGDFISLVSYSLIDKVCRDGEFIMTKLRQA